MQNEVWTTLKLIKWTDAYLSSKGVQNSRREAEWLLSHALSIDRVGLYLNFEKPLTEEECGIYREFVKRRGLREPLQHIIGTEEFYGREFIVNRDVLIPRHDTETIIEAVLKLSPNPETVLDIGTGSGCIAITVAKEFPKSVVTAVDISADALEIAKKNADILEALVDFVVSDLFSAIDDKSFDLILSNPPYICTEEIDKLEPEVAKFDPKIALDGGIDGLQIYAKLVTEAPKHLNAGGWLILEIGKDQENDLLRMLQKEAVFQNIQFFRDNGGIVRVVAAEKGE